MLGTTVLRQPFTTRRRTDPNTSVGHTWLLRQEMEGFYMLAVIGKMMLGDDKTVETDFRCL